MLFNPGPNRDIKSLAVMQMLACGSHAQNVVFAFAAYVALAELKLLTDEALTELAGLVIPLFEINDRIYWKSDSPTTCTINPFRAQHETLMNRFLSSDQGRRERARQLYWYFLIRGENPSKIECLEVVLDDCFQFTAGIMTSVLKKNRKLDQSVWRCRERLSNKGIFPIDPPSEPVRGRWPSRRYREEIRVTVLNKSLLRTPPHLINSRIPDDIPDPEVWVRELDVRPDSVKKKCIKKLAGLPEIPEFLPKQNNRALVFPAPKNTPRPASSEDRFRAAQVLARCSNVRYDANAIPIFTRKRLNRKVKLINFCIDKFYELD